MSAADLQTLGDGSDAPGSMFKCSLPAPGPSFENLSLGLWSGDDAMVLLRYLLVAALAILSWLLIEGTGSLPTFYSLKTHTRRRATLSIFACPPAFPCPCPLALTAFSQPENKLKDA